MDKTLQKRAPIYEALERFRRNRVVPFDVPGHKHGRGNPELVQLLGERCVSIDVNSMKPLDNGGRFRGGPCVPHGGRDHVGGPVHDLVLL